MNFRSVSSCTDQKLWSGCLLQSLFVTANKKSLKMLQKIDTSIDDDNDFDLPEISEETVPSEEELEEDRD